MISLKKAETLVGIVIGVFILSFVVIGIGVLLVNSKNLINTFDQKTDLDLLSSSAYSIINSLDVSSLSDSEVFYINKNTLSKQFEVYPGEQNFAYKYIDREGNNIPDPESFSGDVYARIFYTKKVIVNGEEKTAVKALIRRLIR